jgi:hypothetical protein
MAVPTTHSAPTPTRSRRQRRGTATVQRPAAPSVERLHPDDLASIAALVSAQVEAALSRSTLRGAQPPAPFGGQEWISLKAAEEHLGVSRHNLMNRIQEGAFKHMRCGDVWRINTASFLAWVGKSGSLDRPDRPATRAEQRRRAGEPDLDEILA